MDNQSITHTRWNCIYHIVFIPKYRRKIMYGETKKDLVAIIKKLCEMKQVDLIDGRVCKDHIHMYVAIPPKISVSEFMSYLKGKSTLMLFDRHPEYRTKWGDRHFWARGYFVSTVGNVNEETIRKYIQEQEENDKLYEQRQTQRAYERKIRLYKNKIDSFKEIGDFESVDKYKKKLKTINQVYSDYCETNDLKRNYAREQGISLNIKNPKTISDVNACKDVSVF